MALLVLSVLGFGGASLLGLAGFRLRATTLWPAALWGLAAWAVVFLVETAHASPSTLLSAATSGHLRYVALAFSLAPGAAVLGAKRPQHNAWQLIVASLLFVLLLPSLRSWAFSRGGHPETHPLLLVLIGGLLLSNLFNYLLSPRYRISAGFWCAMQLRLGWRVLVGPPSDESVTACWGAILFAFLALAFGAWETHRAARTTPGWPRVWADFCALFGGFWPLRVLDRVNQQAAAEGWPCRLVLGWHATISQESAADSQRGQAEFEQALGALLRRFVSREWIEARLPASSPSNGESPTAACATSGEQLDSTHHDSA